MKRLFIVVAIGIAFSLISPNVAAGQYSYYAFLPIVRFECAPAELVSDGSFEAGLPNSHWFISSSVGSDVLDDTAIPPAWHGSWKAWLGGDDSVHEVLSQTIYIPPVVSQLHVRYWQQISTIDGGGSDVLSLTLRSAAGVPLQVLDWLTDQQAGTTWQQRAITIPATSYAGQSLQLVFEAVNDSSFPTSFFIDNVSIIATCP